MKHNMSYVVTHDLLIQSVSKASTVKRDGRVSIAALTKTENAICTMFKGEI